MTARRQTEAFPGRDFYKGGGVDWPRFLGWLVLPFVAAALLAAGMFALFTLGQYYVVIVPLLAAVGVAALIALAVNKGHCRSRWIGGLAGGVAGLVLYVGYFYLGMVYHLGPDTAARPDLLPYYVRARMESDVIRDVGRDTDEEARPRKGDSWFNWVTFAIEIVGVLGITSMAGVQRARKPYCARCRQWMIREVTQFEPAQADAILEALRTGSVRALAAIGAQPVFATVPNATLAAEFCPTLKEGMTRDCPVYASLKQVTVAANTPTRDAFDAPKGRLLLRSLQLTPDEIAALGSRIKVFVVVAGRAAVAALQPEDSRPEDRAAEAGPVAEVKPVEPDYAGRVLTRRTALIGNAFAFAGLLLIVAGVGLAAWGGMIAFPDKGSPQTVSPEKKAAGIALLSVGGLLFASTAVFFFVNPSYFGNRFLLRRVRAEFSRRPKALVDPLDPEALFVEIVPKLNWGRMMLETASDVGFLKLDPRRREVLFEGDRQRFRIPAGAITYAGVEIFVEGQGTSAATKVYFVVLRARHPGEFWEVPLRERSGTGKLRARRRKKSAEQLFQAIQNIRGIQPDVTIKSVQAHS